MSDRTELARRGATIAGRGLSLFWGTFGAFNLVAALSGRYPDYNVWWVDFRWLPGWIAVATLWIGTAGLLWHGVLGCRRARERWVIGGVTGLLALVSLANALAYWKLLLADRIGTSLPIPLSLLVFASLLVVLFSMVRPGMRGMRFGSRSFIASAGIAACCGVAFPLLQMVCFGKTDYRRSADAAVVFGARVYESGAASQALRERVNTAIDLYQAGLVQALIFSGGPGDGAVHETEAMKRMALGRGVPESAIVTDTQGLNTWATVENTLPLFAQGRFRRVIAVSHFYHLPRIKLAYQSRGQEVWTVPANEERMLWKLPIFMARETAALWVYYLRCVKPCSRPAVQSTFA